MKHKRLNSFIKPLTLLTIATVFLFSLPALLSFYPRLFTVHDAAKGADLIVLLGGEPLSRAPGAAEAFNAGYAPRVAVTTVREPSEKFARYFFTETVQVSRALTDENITHVIIPSLKGGATSTYDEAWDVAEWIKLHQPEAKRIILVTDGFHTRRARYAFNKVFKKAGAAIEVQCYAAPNERYTDTNWWRTEKGISAYFLETIKWMIYPLIDSNVKGIEES